MRELYWENILALSFVHAGAVAAVIVACIVGVHPATAALAAVWFVFCMFSTTGGYHRLFAHRAYRASAPLRVFYLLFGAASGENSVIDWAADHRMHHARVDTDDDPYNVRRSFWWAHMGWLFYKPAPLREDMVRDLIADPLARWQQRFYLPLLVFMGFLLPGLIAWTWGDPLGGLLGAGFFRLALQYQATFCINSVAHYFGRQPYTTANSARDNTFAALLTLGEGYHNYHHKFPGDYRNGVRWFEWDPTKWLVWLFSKVGLAWDLRRVPDDQIARARLEVATGSERRLTRRAASAAGRP